MIFNSSVNFILFSIKNIVNNKVLSSLLLILILMEFILYRVPGIFDVHYFIIFLVVLLLPYFISLFSNRVVSDWEEFFCSFTPVGAPIGIAPFVCIAEGISYIVRPFVLVLRPFLNLTIGAFGALSLGGFISSSFNPIIFVLFLFIFFYEIFVSLVHWFIVSNILIFFIDH
uniref:ATP synthase F0 subunit 6 n=1 Tax=Gyrodactylus kobayashii TaxID=89149 RepID=A0A166A477_9PLAT|nr:ATP synthase F0 subunit 6 [Gyrodactylus kobayashii]AMZ79730.1 ATP synthase F0 subunit 6 [Gyrodactylus kobayashii]